MFIDHLVKIPKSLHLPHNHFYKANKESLETLNTQNPSDQISSRTWVKKRTLTQSDPVAKYTLTLSLNLYIAVHGDYLM